MDHIDIERMEHFEELWQRVSGCVSAAPAPPPAPTPPSVQTEEDRLWAFIADELCDCAFYTALARMFQGQNRAVLLSHAADEKQHARHLRAEYFIRSGVSYIPNGVCEPVTGKLASLRTALLHELAGAAAYRRAAELTDSPELRTLYLCHAEDEERHARENRELLLDCFA